MARGAVVAALTGAGLPIYEYAPRRVKQAVCGYGNASKEQVALLMSQILGIRVDEIPHDATDALAIAVCHGQTAHAAQGLVLPAPL
jgi:crossover junction endodeoxyribonuclease RuvC